MGYLVMYLASQEMRSKVNYHMQKRSQLLRSGGLKVRLAQVDCVGEFKGKGNGRVFGNDQR